MERFAVYYQERGKWYRTLEEKVAKRGCLKGHETCGYGTYTKEEADEKVKWLESLGCQAKIKQLKSKA